jgi:hypothetical protein
MTQAAIQEQLDAQKKTAEKALKSKGATTKYLIKIGAIKPDKKGKKQIK